MKKYIIVSISLMVILTSLTALLLNSNTSAENELCNEDSTFNENPNYLDSLAISPDNKLVAGGGREGGVYVVNSANASLVKKLDAHSDMVSTVEFSRDVKYLVSGSFDGEVKIWSTSNWSCLKILTTNITRVIELEFTNNGSWLVVLFYDHSNIRQAPIIGIYSVGDWHELKNITIEDGWGYDSMALSYDDRLIGVSAIKRFFVIDTYTWDIREIECESYSISNQLAFSPDSRYLAYVHDEIAIYSTITWELQSNFSRNGTITSVEFSPDSRYLGCSFYIEAPDFTIWETKEWRLIQNIDAPSGGVGNSIRFAENNEFMAGAHFAITTYKFDSDRDGILDEDDWDDDNDGVNDTKDPVPKDPSQWEDLDGDGNGDNQSGNNSDVFPYDPTQWKDIDGDGYGDNPAGNNPDIFPYDPTEWADTDGDGIGDNKDTDNDNDGVDDSEDAFPYDPEEWADTDGDGIGDNSDWDNDNDGWPNEAELEAGSDPYDPSSVPEDLDNDTIPDTLDTDIDGDSYLNEDDDFPEDPEEWSDNDSDGTGDNSDEFPDDNSEWLDSDDDGVGDNSDAFPNDPLEQIDTDSDNIGNNADSDDDNDGLSDADEAIMGTNPLLTDTDSDGYDDAEDDFPLDPNKHEQEFENGEILSIFMVVIIIVIILIVVSQLIALMALRKKIVEKRVQDLRKDERIKMKEPSSPTRKVPIRHVPIPPPPPPPPEDEGLPPSRLKPLPEERTRRGEVYDDRWR